MMTPAAYHRQAKPEGVNEGMVRIASRLLTIAMLPLALGMALDLYVVARLAVGTTTGIVTGVLSFCLFIGLWFVWPRRNLKT